MLLISKTHEDLPENNIKNFNIEQNKQIIVELTALTTELSKIQQITNPKWQDLYSAHLSSSRIEKQLRDWIAKLAK